MRRSDWWTRRLLEKLNSPDNNWIKAGEKYAARIAVSLIVGVFTTGVLLAEGQPELGFIVFVIMVAIVVYNAVIGHRVEKALKERALYTFSGMRQEQYGDDDGYDSSDIFMFRISRYGGSDEFSLFDGIGGLGGSELMEEVFSSDDLEETKRKYFEMAKQYLNVSTLEGWKECDMGFEIWHDDIRILLVTDTEFIPQPPNTTPIASAPIRV